MTTKTESEFEQSVWDMVETFDCAPKYCPHCGEKIAYPWNLSDNDDIDADGRLAAYRKHRQAHYSWGTDPTDDNGRDPYLADYYDSAETDDGSNQDSGGDTQ